MVVLDVFQFVSFLQLGFLLQYPRRVSLINAKVKNKVSSDKKLSRLIVFFVENTFMNQNKS